MQDFKLHQHTLIKIKIKKNIQYITTTMFMTQCADSYAIHWCFTLWDLRCPNKKKYKTNKIHEFNTGNLFKYLSVYSADTDTIFFFFLFLFWGYVFLVCFYGARFSLAFEFYCRENCLVKYIQFFLYFYLQNSFFFLNNVIRLRCTLIILFSYLTFDEENK